MDTENHPSPLQDAMQEALRHAVEVAYLLGTGAQNYLHHKRTQSQATAERDQRARRALNAQIRAERDAARAGWAPALDPDWLRQADLLQTARAWGAAMAYADRAQPWYEPAAAAAMRKCEDRLRVLHPYAMARYDRLRTDGMSPAHAMREAAPLFAREPRVHDTPFTPRPVLEAGNGSTLWVAGEPRPAPDEPGPGASREAQERRGKQIIGQIQARARAAGRAPLGPAQQRTVLETLTNLPPAVIDEIVQRGAAGAANTGTAGIARTEFNRAAAAHGVRAADLDAASGLQAIPAADERTQNVVAARDAATTGDAATAQAARGRPWERDFPTPITTVVAAARQSPSGLLPAARLAARGPVRRLAV